MAAAISISSVLAFLPQKRGKWVKVFSEGLGFSASSGSALVAAVLAGASVGVATVVAVVLIGGNENDVAGTVVVVIGSNEGAAFGVAAA